MNEKVTKYYKTMFCLACGHFDLPEEMTGTAVVENECCPECGEGERFAKKIGRFTYRQGRTWTFKKYFDITGFKPGLDAGKQKRKVTNIKRHKGRKR